MTKTYTPRALAGEIHDIILDLDVLWDQNSWFYQQDKMNYFDAVDVAVWLEELKNPSCGTTACVAGWAGLLTAPVGTKVTDCEIIYPDGRRRQADSVGQDALGLDREHSDWLFSSSRSKEEVLEALAAIRDGLDFEVSEEDPGYWDDEDDYYED